MKQVVLASGSPRRTELLTMLGVPHRVHSSGFPEEKVRFEDFDSDEDYVLTLATGKALAVADEIPDEALIVAADTLVFLDGEPIGKPKNLDHAREILQRLSGKTHHVITALCVFDTLTREQLTDVVRSDVTFLPLSDQQIDQYVSTSESLGKAGAYAIQSGARTFVREVRGSLSNIVGLPLVETAALLEQMGIPLEVSVRDLDF